MKSGHALRMVLAGIEGLEIDYVTVYPSALAGRRSASVVFLSDEAARRVAQELGAAEVREVGDGRSLWSTVDIELGDMMLTIAGPMRPRLGVVP